MAKCCDSILITLPHVWQYGVSSFARYRGAGTFELAEGLLQESIHDMVENDAKRG